eukprot:TRINITY_DN9458_c0_g2_i1.p2 TRINITY_DN9458_c0_g2~~TRINITY_DN9458_c0_g2_i1.p2  ORF type:complete len:268 (+),score=25.46 TRINITY_DN9458_c0_g2_i1:126-929(+)
MRACMEAGSAESAGNTGYRCRQLGSNACLGALCEGLGPGSSAPSGSISQRLRAHALLETVPARMSQADHAKMQAADCRGPGLPQVARPARPRENLGEALSSAANGPCIVELSPRGAFDLPGLPVFDLPTPARSHGGPAGSPLPRFWQSGQGEATCADPEAVWAGPPEASPWGPQMPYAYASCQAPPPRRPGAGMMPPGWRRPPDFARRNAEGFCGPGPSDRDECCCGVAPAAARGGSASRSGRDRSCSLDRLQECVWPTRSLPVAPL